jgi:hypothetical protein
MSFSTENSKPALKLIQSSGYRVSGAVSRGVGVGVGVGLYIYSPMRLLVLVHYKLHTLGLG